MSGENVNAKNGLLGTGESGCEGTEKGMSHKHPEGYQRYFGVSCENYKRRVSVYLLEEQNEQNRISND